MTINGNVKGLKKVGNKTSISLDFTVTREEGRLFETGVGVMVPLLPFNNEIVVTFDCRSSISDKIQGHVYLR